MKDNKNVVFALRSFRKENEEYKPEGYLLFPDETKAMDFMQLCEHLNRHEKKCHYEKYTWVKVVDFIADRVNSQKQFYVNEAEPYTEQV